MQTSTVCCELFCFSRSSSRRRLLALVLVATRAGSLYLSRTWCSLLGQSAAVVSFGRCLCNCRRLRHLFTGRLRKGFGRRRCGLRSFTFVYWLRRGRLGFQKNRRCVKGVYRSWPFLPAPEQRAHPEHYSQQPARDGQLRQTVVPFVFGGAGFAEPAACEQVPIRPLYLFPAVAAEIRLIKHWYYRPGLFVLSLKEGTKSRKV
jgi:hypothetical protein